MTAMRSEICATTARSCVTYTMAMSWTAARRTSSSRIRARVLRNVGHEASAKPTYHLGVPRVDAPAGDGHFPRADTGAALGVAEQRQGGCGLAGSRLADDAEDGPRLELERDVLHDRIAV